MWAYFITPGQTMAKNTLFNFLSQGEAAVQLPPGYQLALDTNKASRHYYRIECPTPTQFILKDKENKYELLTHHVSIYENEYRDNPKLSQYHYTAEFINQLGEHYRLHVYFNTFDELLANIAFEQEIDGAYQPIDTKSLRNQFIRLALKHTEPLMKQLKQQQNELIKTLDARYNDCDERLAKYFDANVDKTIEALPIMKEACTILRELIPLTRSPNYPKLLHFYEMSVRALERQSTPVLAMPLSQAPNIHKNESTHADGDIVADAEVVPQDVGSSKTAITVTKTNPPTQPKNSTVKREIKTLSLQLEKLMEASEEVQAKAIEDLLAKTYEISLSYEHQIELEDLRQLQKIRRELHKLGTNLLPTLLFKGQFNLAALLTSAHHLLRAEKYLSVALQTHNSRLLDFILQYGDVDINNQPVSVYKKAYPSMVQACLAVDSLTSSMSECLSVLIRHGASLFMPDPKGLPLVYSILSDATHPLYKALLMNRDKTIESIDFLKNLIVILRDYLEQRDLSASEANALEAELKSFEVQLECLQNAQLKDPSSRFLMKQIHHLEERYFGSLVSRLRKDPDIMAVNEQIQNAVHQLNAKLTKTQLRQNKISASNYIETLDKALAHVDVASLEFEFLKAEVLKNLNNNLQLIEKRSELIDVQKEITRGPHSKKGYKAYRGNLRQQDILLQEINELASGLPQEETMQEFLELNKTLESLQGMGNLVTQFSSIFSSIAPTSQAPSTDNADEEETELELEALANLGSFLKKTFGK